MDLERFRVAERQPEMTKFYVATKLLTRCGMISGAGFLESAKVESLVESPAPAGTSSLQSQIFGSAYNCFRKTGEHAAGKETHAVPNSDRVVRCLPGVVNDLNLFEERYV